MSKKLASLALALSLANAPASEAQPMDQKPGWQQVHHKLQRQRDTLAQQLATARTKLKARIPVDKPQWHGHLTETELRATGYGLLPVIEENPPLETQSRAAQTYYSLKWLEDRFGEEHMNIRQLLEQVGKVEAATKAQAVRFEETLTSFRLLEDHLSYHDHWQQSVRRHPVYFQRKNELIGQIRAWQAQTSIGEHSAQTEHSHQQIMAQAAPFRATPGLHIKTAPNGNKTLAISLCTDIEDRRFLERFQQSIDEAYNRAAAAQTRNFVIALSWSIIGATHLYQDKPPVGAAVNITEHRARFTDCPLVLTTGATSTYAQLGNFIALGSAPLTARTLAHEFGHLLGFEDAYVRGYDGKPTDPYGVTLVEWSGLSNDLMGNSSAGEVSGEMIDTLIAAYTPKPEHTKK